HRNPLSEYVAEHLAADTGSASGASSHDTLVGGDDRNTDSPLDLGQPVRGIILTHTRTPGALELFNYRLALGVLQFDGPVRLGGALNIVTGYIAFFGQYFGYSHLQLCRRHADTGLFSHLGITDTGQHIC